MLITGIYKRKGKYEVYIDHQYAFSVSEEGLYLLKLTTGQKFVPSDEVNRILKEDEVIRCKNRALWIVSSTSKSTKILRQKLKSENFSDLAIEKTLLFMREYSFVDDEELARSIIRSGERKNHSRLQTQRKLYEKGITKEIIETVMNDTEWDELSNALEIAKRKYRSIQGKEEKEIIKKIKYALSYRGFSYDAIQYASQGISRLIKEEEQVRGDEKI